MKTNVMRILCYLCAFTLGFFMLQAYAGDFAPIPPFQSFVTDKVGMLDASQRNSVEGFLKAYEARTGSQIGILLISSTAPEVIEQYGIRVADAWKLGRKGIDDGVILIVARDNPKALRRLRIETGRGVQGTLTDAQSKRILQDVIAPHFRTDDYYGGLMAGVLAIANLVDKAGVPGVNEKSTAKIMQSPPTHESNGRDMATYFIFWILVVGGIAVLVLILYIVYKLWQLGVFILGKFIKLSPAEPDKKAKKKSRRRKNSDSGFQFSFGSSSNNSSGSSSSSSSDGGGSFDGGGSSGDW